MPAARLKPFLMSLSVVISAGAIHSSFIGTSEHRPYRDLPEAFGGPALNPAWLEADQ
jgi:hypothetical protein